jgi:hypothetical protein
MRYDHYESNVDWFAAVLWCLLLCLFVWNGIREHKLMRLERRLNDLEMYQGPATPTEWTLINGKVVLYQSPYTVQVTP